MNRLRTRLRIRRQARMRVDQQTPLRKIISGVCNTLGITILVIIIIVVGAILALQIAGYIPMAILSPSMEPEYKVDGLVFVDSRVKPEELELNDVIAFRRPDGSVMTHRLIAVGDGTVTTRGDKNNIEDAPVPFDAVIGRVWLYIPEMGYYMMNLKTEKGLAAGALLLAVLITLFVIPVLLAPDKPDKTDKDKKGEK